MREVSAPVLDKGLLPPYCLGFRKPLPGSRVVSRYSCLSVSSFRKRECKQERNRQSERKRQKDRRRGGKWDNATDWEELGFHKWTREKQQHQVQLEKETMWLGWLIALFVCISTTVRKHFVNCLTFSRYYFKVYCENSKWHNFLYSIRDNTPKRENSSYSM